MELRVRAVQISSEQNRFRSEKQFRISTKQSRSRDQLSVGIVVRIRTPAGSGRIKIEYRDAINTRNSIINVSTYIGCFRRVTSLALVPGSNRCFKNPALLVGRKRISGDNVAAAAAAHGGGGGGGEEEEESGG
ncbi:protein OCTOPUS [Dorcoceras hygrometricum]|uniref:Protein OCTOPUS n=1 Tax=Dorcoceras hygrometricum TaxID=472368 RepID=A0A2Z7A0G8_9LAMI|nr:protein OCTOPUS [Dorcoceras hygrometricum]